MNNSVSPRSFQTGGILINLFFVLFLLISFVFWHNLPTTYLHIGQNYATMINIKQNQHLTQEKRI